MASVVMRVLCLGACLSVGLGSVKDTQSTMNKALKNLFLHYKADKQGITGSPVFSIDFLQNSTIEDNEKKVLMVGLLEVYEKMIGQMLDKNHGGQNETRDSPDGSVQEAEAEIRQNLRYVLGEVRDLLEHKYHDSSLLKKQMLDLQNITTNSTQIQKKALSEFPWLYQQATKLVEDGEGHSTLTPEGHIA